MSDIKLLSDYGQDDIFPVARRESFFKANHPFPALFILGVFPRGLNAVFEQMEVGSRLDIIDSYEVIINSPEVLDLNEKRVGIVSTNALL